MLAVMLAHMLDAMLVGQRAPPLALHGPDQLKSTPRSHALKQPAQIAARELPERIRLVADAKRCDHKRADVPTRDRRCRHPPGRRVTARASAPRADSTPAPR